MTIHNQHAGSFKGTCPNCGYCPCCGRSLSPAFAPYYIPTTTPYWYQPGYSPQWTVTRTSGNIGTGQGNVS